MGCFKSNTGSTSVSAALLVDCRDKPGNDSEGQANIRNNQARTAGREPGRNHPELNALLLVRCDCRRFYRLLQRRHAVLDGLLHFFEGAHFNLAHALARHTELGCKLLERDRVVGQSSGLEYAPLALVEHVERRDQRLVPIVALLALGENALLARRLIDKPILPLAAFAIVAYR